MSEPIRVLQVFAQMNKGGAETMIMNIYRNIDRDKVQFDFVVHTLKRCDYDDEILALGGKLYSVPRFRGYNIFNYIFAWISIFQNHKEHVIVHGHVRSTAIIYILISKVFHRITIIHSHSISSGKGVTAMIKNILQYPIRFLSDYLVACSLTAGEWLFGKKVKMKDNFMIINNAIDVEKYIFNPEIRANKRQEFKIGDNLVIGHIGRFDYVKNHELIIEIFEEINRIQPKSILILIGDGKLKKQIENEARKSGINDKIIFTGIRNDVPELLMLMDVFLFPSIFEGFAIAVMEAQASGLPCIISDKIPNETRLSDLVEVIPLNAPKDVWVESVLRNNRATENRHNYYKKIVNKGYDIKENVKWIEQFYLTIEREKSCV